MYEQPQEFKAIRLVPVESDEVPYPGTGYITVFVDDDTGAFVARTPSAEVRFTTSAMTLGSSVTLSTSGVTCGTAAALSATGVTCGTQKVVFDDAAPTAEDVYGLGSIWVRTTAENVGMFVLTAIDEGSATWTQLQPVGD